MTKNYKGTEIDDCAFPNMTENDIEEIRGMVSGTLVGFKCKICKGWWKTYQNKYHSQNCKYKNRYRE